LNALGERITSAWNIRLYGTYASTEMQTAFTECEHGVGGHHHPELLIVEILDSNNQPVDPGEMGELTITTLGVEAMPLLRYKTGDMTSVHADKCKCGRATLRVGPIVGRKQHLLKLKGTTIYPAAIFEILNSANQIDEFVVEVWTSDLGTDELRVYIAVKNGFEKEVVVFLKDKFQSRLRMIPEVICLSNPDLNKKLLGSSAARKIRKFIDLRKDPLAL
jgi:phenylacetate-CoA ligase